MGPGLWVLGTGHSAFGCSFVHTPVAAGLLMAAAEPGRRFVLDLFFLRARSAKEVDEECEAGNEEE